MSATVVICSTTYCRYCRADKGVRQQQGIALNEVDVTHDRGARHWLARTTGQTTVSQIPVGDKPIGGFTERAALVRSRKFAELVAGSDAAAADAPKESAAGQ